MSIKSYISNSYHFLKLKRNIANTIRSMRIDEAEKRRLEKDYWELCKSAKISINKFYELWHKYPVDVRQQVMKDYLTLYETKGLTTEEYWEFEFEKCTKVFRQTFLGVNEQREYLDYLNPIKYYILARNKYFAHKMLENTGVRKSELYCYYEPEARYILSDEKASCIQEVIRILKQKNAHSCVIKTTEGTHGSGVSVFKNIEFVNDDAVLTRFDGEEILLSSLLNNDSLIFESVVHQTTQFSSFNASSVNTIRVITTLHPNGSAKVVAAIIRIGRAGKCVDNAGSGGNVDVGVDVETGELKHAFQFDGWRNITEIDKHPDSGNQLKGVFINNWQGIVKDIESFQQAFPYCKAAGWDIAITDEGPVVIEVNDFWDKTFQYFILRGWRDEIRDCYLEWKKTGKKYHWMGRVILHPML